MAKLTGHIMTMKNSLILSIRPKVDGIKFKKLAELEGLKTITSPILDIKTTRDSEITEEINEKCGDYNTYLIFTSANAVRSFAQICLNRNIRAISIGDSTSFELKSIGVKNIQQCAEPNFKSLCDLIENTFEVKKHKFFYISGKHTKGNLVDTLKERDKYFKIKKFITYEAKEQELHAPNFSKVTHVAFFSERTASLFLNQVENIPLSGKKAIAISKNIFDMLLDKGFDEILMSKEISNLAVIETIKEDIQNG